MQKFFRDLSSDALSRKDDFVDDVGAFGALACVHSRWAVTHCTRTDRRGGGDVVDLPAQGDLGDGILQCMWGVGVVWMRVPTTLRVCSVDPQRDHSRGRGSCHHAPPLNMAQTIDAEM